MEELHEDDHIPTPDPAEDVQAPLVPDHGSDLPVHDFIVDLPIGGDPILDAPGVDLPPSGADLPAESAEHIDPYAAADAIWHDVDASPSSEHLDPDAATFGEHAGPEAPAAAEHPASGTENSEEHGDPDAATSAEHPDPYAANPEAPAVTYETAMAAIDAMANDALNQESVPASFPGFDQFNGIHGTPIEDLGLWEQQSQPFSCAVATTDMLFRSCGFDVGEPALTTLFQSQGIYDPNMGTDVHQIAEVLNHAAVDSGIHVEAVEIQHFSEQNLEALLDHGVRPLIGVNSAELYDPAQRFLNSIGVIPNTGHAVQLTGIIKNEQGSFAVINDPGFPDGGGRVIPLELFMDAASKMGFDAVALIPT